MGVDQPSQRLAIGGPAAVPVMQVSKLAQTCAPAGFRHARQAEIDAIGEEDGEKRLARVGLPARTPVDDDFGEPGPTIDLKQMVGDLHPVTALIDWAPGN